MAEIKKMSVKEFRELGYLQELNRCFLHPLGLALEVKLLENGEEQFGDVWDSRDDPEGFVFGPGMIDPDRAERILAEQFEKRGVRVQKLGFNVQPVDQ